MNDRFQADAARHAAARQPDFETEPPLSVRRQRPGVPVWVWVLLLAVSFVFVAVCGGMAVLGSLFWLGYSDFELPAPTADPPIIEIVQPAEEP